MAEPLVIPPPSPKIFDYPVTLGIAGCTVAASILLFTIKRFDPTGGTLAISLMILLIFIGVISFSLFFTVPNDEVTSAVIGGLTAAVGAVVTYWLSRPRGPPE